jgi:hypothetical protein
LLLVELRNPLGAVPVAFRQEAHTPRSTGHDQTAPPTKFAAGAPAATAFLIGKDYSTTATPGDYAGQVQVVQKYETVVSLP